MEKDEQSAACRGEFSFSVSLKLKGLTAYLLSKECCSSDRLCIICCRWNTKKKAQRHLFMCHICLSKYKYSCTKTSLTVFRQHARWILDGPRLHLSRAGRRQGARKCVFNTPDENVLSFSPKARTDLCTETKGKKKKKRKIETGGKKTTGKKVSDFWVQSGASWLENSRLHI